MISPSKNKKDKTKKAEFERALDFVTKFFEESEDYTRTYFSKFDKLLGEYLAAKNTKRNPFTRSQLRPPTAFSIVEAYKSELLEAFLGGKPYIGAQGRTQFAKQFEKTLEDFSTYQLDRSNVYSKLDCVLNDMLLYGTGVVKVNWRVKEKMVREVDPLTGNKVFVKKIVEDRPNFQNIDIRDFFPDPTCTVPGDIDSMRGCIHRLWRTFKELKVNEKRKMQDGSFLGIYENLDELEISLKDDEEDSEKSLSNKDYREKEALLGLETGVKQKGKLDIKEYWGLYDYNNDGKLKECVITTVNDKVCIRIQENPYDGQFKPFVAAVDYQIEGDFYGIGEIEFIWSYLQEYKALRNARLDTVNLAINRMFVVDRSAGFNLENIYSRGGGLLVGDDINGLRQLDPPDATATSFQELKDMEINMQQTVGAPNPAATSSYARTAEGVKYIQQITSSRTVKKVRILSEKFFSNLIKQFFLLNTQFLDGNILFRVTGDSTNIFQLVDPISFDQEYDFLETYAFERLTKKDRQGNLFQNILPMLQMSEKYRPGSVKWDYVVKSGLSDFDYRDVDKAVSSPEEIAQFQQGQMQAQMQMAEHNAQAQAQAQLPLVLAKANGDSDKNDVNAQSKIANTLIQSLAREKVESNV